jgi:hypothetical protein
MSEHYSFILKSETDYFRLKIVSIFGFPDETHFMGGYDTESYVEIKSGGYAGLGVIYITTSQVNNFYKQLVEGYKSLSGSAILNDYEDRLAISAEFDGIGHLDVSGRLEDTGNKLTFKFVTDQTYIPELLKELKLISDKYGDEKGAKSSK